MPSSSQRPQRRLTSAASGGRFDLPQAPLAWPLPAAGAIAAAWSVAMSVMLLLIVFTFAWIATADPASSYDSALKAAVTLWLFAHSSPVTIEPLTFGLTPLLLTLPLMWGLKRGVRWAIRSTRITNAAGVLGLILSVAATYSVLALLLSLTIGPDVRVNASRTLLFAGLWAIAAAIWAVTDSPGLVVPVEPPSFDEPGQRTRRIVKVRAPHDVLVELWRDIPQPIRHGILIATRVLSLQAALAAAIAVILILWRSTEISSIVNMLADSTTDTVAVVTLTAMYVPTVILWIVSVLLGPGFVMGEGSPYSFMEQQLGALPGLPFLAVMPASLPTWSIIAVLLSLVTAVLGSMKWLNQLHRARVTPQLGYFLMVILSATITSAVFGFVVALLSSGALGGGRYLVVGPVALKLALAAAGWTVLGVSLAVTMHRFARK